MKPDINSQRISQIDCIIVNIGFYLDVLPAIVAFRQVEDVVAVGNSCYL